MWIVADIGLGGKWGMMLAGELRMIFRAEIRLIPVNSSLSRLKMSHVCERMLASIFDSAQL